MELHHTERTQVRRPVASPVNLDDGQLDVKRAAAAGGFVTVALVVAIVGVSLVGWSAEIGEQAGLLAIFGLALTLVALTFGGVVMYVSLTEWLDRRRRMQEWHSVMLSCYNELGGAETVDQVNEWSLTTENPAHVLLAALWVHLRFTEGVDCPWSVRQLRGPVLLAHQRVGEFSKLGAEQMSRHFASLGLVAGRREGSAGEWVPRSTDEVVSLVLQR